MITITGSNSPGLFTLNRLTPSSILDFACHIPEYTDYLTQEALKSQEDMVAVTYLLQEQSTGAIVAYMSLIADAIKLNTTEKELHKLDYPFKTLPAMKLAKLAAASAFKARYKGIGSHLIDIAAGIATPPIKIVLPAVF